MASSQPARSQYSGQPVGSAGGSDMVGAVGGRKPARGWSALFTPLAEGVGSLGRRSRSYLRGVGNTLMLSSLLLLGGIAAGALLSVTWQKSGTGTLSALPSSPITRQSGREIVASTIARLEAEQAELKKQIADLRSRLNDLQSTEASRRTTLSELNQAIERQRMAAGLVAVHGPGIIATFDDSTDTSIPQNEDPANYIIHDYDLRDVLNTLWIAGAEAISVNGERVVDSTSLYCVGTTVICNATRLSPPYEVRAIGDPAVLAAALQGHPQMDKFNQRARIYDLPVTIEQKPDLLIPAYNGSFVFKYARPNQK